MVQERNQIASIRKLEEQVHQFVVSEVEGMILLIDAIDRFMLIVCMCLCVTVHCL